MTQFVPYSRLTYSEAVEAILRAASSTETGKTVFTPNVQHFHLYNTDSAFKEAYDSADFHLVDGMPLVWFLNHVRKESVEKISGSDIFITLFEEAEKANLRISLLGGAAGVGERVADVLCRGEEYRERVQIISPPMHFEEDEKANDAVLREIDSHRPNLLFVALGAPRQELWIYRNKYRLRANITLGVGASFDFVAGVQKRAPIWMQKAGLEWFYRMMKDPRRLFMRYLITNSYFLAYVLKEV